jgi:ubiquinone/menaquinone biosynthesis C-methylase UbiE
MNSIDKEKIKEFGNPSAYYDNRLFKYFSDMGQLNIFYLMVYYGHNCRASKDILLPKKYNRLLTKKIRYQQDRINRISKLISNYKKPSIWLDLGCGVGQFVEKISELESSFVVGTDTNYFSLKTADRFLRQFISPKKYFLINQDKSELPFRDNSFDYILSADVFEHVGYKNQIKFLSEIYRILKDKGKVIIHTPNLNRVIFTTLMKKIFYLFNGYNPRHITHAFPKDHISLASASRIRKLSKSIGFTPKLFSSFRTNNWRLKLASFLKLEFILPKSYIVVLSK